ncbi:MAG: plasmid partitioning protein RepB [Paracoccaceae bacterium]|nr:plasmid partitioning protein RepB [Paracoccaceae bacterium]
MAMGKNKTGIMAAITAATEAGAGPTEARERAQRTLPRGTIGSVRAGLGGIQDIDTSLVLSWGPKDRLDVELTAVNTGDTSETIQELVSSIQSAGQQVPVLLRPAKEKDGHFEVIYGRRRILACRKLGMPVKALIRTLDDTEALMAKGLENASRTELSYYERARFAEAILAQGHTRAEVCQALAISKNTLSQLERITRLVPAAIGDGIGAAPGAGRPKWMALAGAFENNQIDEVRALNVIDACPAEAASDDRLEAVLKDTVRRGPRERAADGRSPIQGVQIKSGKSSITLSVAKAGDLKGFAEWLDRHLDGLIAESFERYQTEHRAGEGG